MIRRILTRLAVQITRHERQIVESGVDFTWSNKSWTHNIFRVYELLFGRRNGLKLEMSAQFFKGKVYYHCHSWESVCALTEQFIRSWLSSWKFVPFKLYIPVIQTSQGFPIMGSPYLLALAIDNHTLVVGAGASSFSYTSTGSNLVMLSGTWRAGSTSPTGTPTYNSVSMSNAGVNTSSASVNASLSSWTLINPATGANTWACTSINDASVITVTGANQSSAPDAANSLNHETGEVNTTISVTTVADNCMAFSFYGNSTAQTPSAGAGSTLLDQELTSLFATICKNSTNPITPAGSYSMTTNHASTTGNYMSIMSVAPTGGAVATVRPIPFLSILGVGT